MYDSTDSESFNGFNRVVLEIYASFPDTMFFIVRRFGYYMRGLAKRKTAAYELLVMTVRSSYSFVVEYSIVIDMQLSKPYCILTLVIRKLFALVG